MDDKINNVGYRMKDNRDFTSKRSHLTKDERMPRCYKDVEKIIKSVQSCQNNFKTVMAKSRFRGGHFKKVYNLSLNVLKYYKYIQKIIDKTEILTTETFLRREIASILIYELIYGKGYLPGESKVVTIVQAYENDILKIHQELQNNLDACELNETYIPRYVRVHTLKTSVAYVIKDLESYGFKQIIYEEDISEEKYMNLVRSLERGTFFVDFHFKDILVFAQDENLIELDLYKNGHIFLQDKASYIPVHVLNPDPGSTVLDACAAPGMKSAHIASKMENKGTLIACERDAKRFDILKETLEYGSVKIAKTLCSDFKLIDPNDKAYASVEYILLDPSCSGSGMVNRMDEVTNNEDSTSKERIQKLAGFQIILLKHALKFPSVKRVVYSTCSIHEEENEYVVHEALNAFEHSFKLVPVLPEWFSRGSGSYKYCEMCLRTDPTKHLMNGFFVAVFERIKSHEYEDKYSKKYKKFKSSKNSSEKVYMPDRKLINAYCSDWKTKSKGAFKHEEESSEFRALNVNIENNLLNNVDRKGNCKKKESCENRELNEIKYNLNDTDECKERDYHSSNYEDANVEIVKSKSHKKKSKKSKYTEHTNIEVDKEQEMNTRIGKVITLLPCKAGKQSNDFSDSFPEGDRTNMLQSDIAEESRELITEHKSKKKKKRKYSEVFSHDTVPFEVQNNDTNSDVLEVLKVSKCNESLNKNNTENISNFIAGEDKNLETSLPKKHKKKKKKGHEIEESSKSCNHNMVYSVNFSKNVRTPEHSNEIVNFSLLENSDLFQTRNTHFDDNDVKQTKNKKHKHKKHSKKSDCDFLTESLDGSFPVPIKKVTSDEDAENILDINAKESSFQDKKRTKKKRKIDNSNECLNYSNTNFQNLDLDREVSKKLTESKQVIVMDNVQNEFSKRKKSKKCKSHSKDKE